MQGPRERMVVSAALLIRERGAHATAISDVLQHSGAPRGSAYHYFPGGRTQLLCEAVDYAGEHVAAMINEAEGGLELLDALIDKYRPSSCSAPTFAPAARSPRSRWRRATNKIASGWPR